MGVLVRLGTYDVAGYKYRVRRAVRPLKWADGEGVEKVDFVHDPNDFVIWICPTVTAARLPNERHVAINAAWRYHSPSCVAVPVVEGNRD